MMRVCKIIPIFLFFLFLVHQVDAINKKNDIDIKVYPNPFREEIVISWPGDNYLERVDIYNITGKKVASFWIQEEYNAISLKNLDNLENGMYFLSVYFQDDYKTFQVIKE